MADLTGHNLAFFQLALENSVDVCGALVKQASFKVQDCLVGVGIIDGIQGLAHCHLLLFHELEDYVLDQFLNHK